MKYTYLCVNIFFKDVPLRWSHGPRLYPFPVSHPYDEYAMAGARDHVNGPAIRWWLMWFLYGELGWFEKNWRDSYQPSYFLWNFHQVLWLAVDLVGFYLMEWESQERRGRKPQKIGFPVGYLKPILGSLHGSLLSWWGMSTPLKTNVFLHVWGNGCPFTNYLFYINVH